MAYRCDRCGKGRLIGRNVSHAKNRTRKISKPNLQSFKGVLNGKEGKWRLCAKCLKTIRKQLKKKKSAPKKTSTEKSSS